MNNLNFDKPQIVNCSNSEIPYKNITYKDIIGKDIDAFKILKESVFDGSAGIEEVEKFFNDIKTSATSEEDLKKIFKINIEKDAYINRRIDIYLKKINKNSRFLTEMKKK